MNDPLKYPQLRWPLDIRLERIEEQQVLVIACPLGIAEKPLLLVPAVGPIISRFEGSLSIEEIAAEFEPFGLKQKQIEEIIQLLDDHLFMQSPRFFAAKKKSEEEFLNSETRKAALAGHGYPGSAEELNQQIDECLSQVEKEHVSGNLQGLIAPHIDYRRGWRVYGSAYRNLEVEDKAILLLLGTAHQYSKHLFHLTLKDFDTPLGVMCCAKSFVKNLAVHYGWERGFADEILHKKEHALELQLPFIAKLYPHARIVPILVGSFYQMLQEKKRPEDFEVYECFVKALASCVTEAQKEGDRVAVIAGVDLAHVGTYFGDKQPLTRDFLDAVRSKDQALLSAIEAQDTEKMFSQYIEDRDERRVCGFPSIYLFVDLFERLGIKLNTKLFSYEQSVDWVNDRCVTFAALGCYDK